MAAAGADASVLPDKALEPAPAVGNRTSASVDRGRTGAGASSRAGAAEEDRDGSEEEKRRRAPAAVAVAVAVICFFAAAVACRGRAAVEKPHAVGATAGHSGSLSGAAAGQQRRCTVL